MRINRENVKWAARLMSIVALVALADVLVVVFTRHPFPWTVILPALIPLLISAFVLFPMLRAERG